MLRKGAEEDECVAVASPGCADAGNSVGEDPTSVAVARRLGVAVVLWVLLSGWRRASRWSGFNLATRLAPCGRTTLEVHVPAHEPVELRDGEDGKPVTGGVQQTLPSLIYFQ